MNFIQDEINREFDGVGMKNQRKLIRSLPQTAKSKTNRTIDASRNALASGKRISKNGKIYWETRTNRTDNKKTGI